MDAYVCLRMNMYDPVVDMEKVDFFPQANFQGWKMSANLQISEAYKSDFKCNFFQCIVYLLTKVD